MKINVQSEIGQLKRVLLHRPGREIEYLTPQYMEQLLFDDLPYLKEAQWEHDLFAETLREAGVEVVYLEDLAASVISQSDDMKNIFIDTFIAESGEITDKYKQVLKEYLLSIKDEKELILKTMSGIRYKEVEADGKTPLTSLVGGSERFLTNPVPNLYFTRDPFATIGNGVAINHMYSETRQRETIYGKFIFNHLPDFKEQTPIFYTPRDSFSLEGGDIHNLSSEVIAVGISQRTTTYGIEELARNLFMNPENTVKTVLAFDIPSIRAFMHLDTVFTQVDRDKFLIHPGILSSLRIYEITAGRKAGEIKARELVMSLENVLKEYLGLKHVGIIHCGGKDRIASERE
ncbi:MAG: arginine deiminase family protein, partial [Oscillospiraceae bacterium]